MWRFNLILLVSVLSVSCGRFRVIREWNYINFTWPSENLYHAAVSTGLYVKENNIVAGLKYFDDHFYITLPRMKSGVPATLARIPAGITNDTAPLLMPFPSWEMNHLDDCNALQNVQNIEIDPEGRIWIIDSGRTETYSPNPIVRCPPKLIIFDIKKNMTTTAYTFPDTVASYNNNYLYDIVVDNTDGGYAYITDNSVTDPGIIVFSVKDHHSWKIRHSQTMKADATAITFRVNGIIISAPIHIASLAIGPRIHTSNDRVIVSEDREVFYSPLSSLHMYSLNTSILKNEMNGMNNGEYQGEVRDYGLKASQSVGMGMDNQGILYFSLLSTNSIARWDTHTSFLSGQRIIARDPRYLEWANSFTFDLNGNMTVLVNRLNKFLTDKLNVNEANFWFITSNVGGKSYLYDESIEYNNSQDKIPLLKNATEKSSEPEILPGSAQDPFLIPQPVPTHNENVSPSTTSTPIPELTTVQADSDHTDLNSDHMNTDRMDHGHVNYDHMQQDQINQNHMDETHLSHDHMDHASHDNMDQNSMSHDNMDHTRHDNVDQNHMNHHHMEQGHVSQETTQPNDSSSTTGQQQSQPTSGSTRLIVTLISFLFASCVFLV